VISIITAVLAGKHHFLGEAYASLRSQQMPPGWDWQWVVQEDGTTGTVTADLPDDPRVSAGMGPHGGAATARTVGLGRAEGLFVRALDADDLLTERALFHDITTLLEHPRIGWCVSPAIDLLPDGSLRPGPRDPEPGQLPPRFLERGEEAGLLQVVGTTMCAHTQLVRALGGWPAISPGEDVGLLIAAEAVADGWMRAEPSLLYRRWGGNSTPDSDRRVASAWSPQHAARLTRVEALRAAGWRWKPVNNASGHHNERQPATSPDDARDATGMMDDGITQ
jgi:hypothetical protein